MIISVTDTIRVDFNYCCCPRYLHSFPTRRSSDLLPTSFSSQGPSIRFATASASYRIGRSFVRSISRRNGRFRSEEHTSELQSHHDLVCRLMLEKKKAVDSTI